MNFHIEKRVEASAMMSWLSPIIAIAATLVVSGAFFIFQGYSSLDVFYNFFVAPIQDMYGVSELAVKVTPLLLCAAGLLICYKANVWNIGAEGQFIFGGLMGGWVGLQFIEIDSAWVLVPILVAGALAGAGWAGIAAWLKTRFNTNEILTTIMLNYIAINLLNFAVHGPLRDPDGFNFPESAMFNSSAAMPVILQDTRMHLGIIVAIGLCLAITFILSRFHIGFQIRVLGADVKAAHFAGFNTKWVTWVCLLISGALAGLAGVMEVTSVVGQLTPSISPGYGYAAIIVAFLGRLHPLGIIISAAFLGLLYLGGELAQMYLGLPIAVTSLFQGLLLLFILAGDLFITHRFIAKKNTSTTAEHLKPTVVKE